MSNSDDADALARGEVTCNQKGCEKDAAYLFTWPGNDQAGICQEHAQWALGSANAMGFHLQMIPIARAAIGPKGASDG